MHQVSLLRTKELSRPRSPTPQHTPLHLEVPAMSACWRKKKKKRKKIPLLRRHNSLLHVSPTRLRAWRCNETIQSLIDPPLHHSVRQVKNRGASPHKEHKLAPCTATGPHPVCRQPLKAGNQLLWDPRRNGLQAAHMHYLHVNARSSNNTQTFTIPRVSKTSGFVNSVNMRASLDIHPKP